MKIFTLLGRSHTGSMTLFPMSYDYPPPTTTGESYHYDYYHTNRKGWKTLSPLEKSLSVSLGITSTLSLALMIAVIVVGVDRSILEMDNRNNQSNSTEVTRSLRLAQDFYHSCMHPPDDEVGVAEMRLLLEEMASFVSNEDDSMMTALGVGLSNIRRFLGGGGFVFEMGVGDVDGGFKAVYLTQPKSLGLESVLKSMKIEEVVDKSKEESLSEIYRQLARRLWLLVYPGDAFKVEKVLAEIFEFEGGLMRILDDDDDDLEILISSTTAVNETESMMLNSTMISWLSDIVDRVLKTSSGTNELNNQSLTPVVILRNVKYFEKLEMLLLDDYNRMEVVEKYLKLRILLSYGVHGSYAFQEIFESFRRGSRLGSGSSHPHPRWQTCSELTNEFFGWTISEKFLTVFDGVMKEQLTSTANNLKDAFNQSLVGRSVDWIATDETREFALEKIELMRTFLGFPEWWLLLRERRHQPGGGGDHDEEETLVDSVNSFVEEFYSDINFTDATNYFQNYIEAVMWMSRKRLEQVISTQNVVDSFEERGWPKFDYPTKMESYYSEYLNYLFLPIGVIDRSNPLMEYTFPSIHYGSVGVELARNMLQGVIGDGKLPKWWDNETIENYRNNISACFERQMIGSTQPTSKLPLITGALSISYEAYISMIKDNNKTTDFFLLPGLQDYTPEQLFFLSFAQSQCSHDDRSSSSVVVKNVLANSVEFAEHWGCTLPEDVCRVV